MATLLSVVQDLCKRQNLSVPATVYGSTDQIVVQIMGLLEEEGTDLAPRHPWEGLINEASHTSVATESQGDMATIASNGFRYILNDTIWDRSTRLPVCGPMNPRSWQSLKALQNTGPRYQYRIRGGELLVNPTPVAGESWYFEYVSKNWISDAAGVNFYERFTADTNIILLPDNLVLQGLRWRWKKEKGFDYAEDFRTYEMQVKDAIG
ncbi:MAG TPA: hypothetical protein PLX97_01515, partial [Gemmatales bacterium]|nr:hypothetical protein [Gemmatales bacterium]